MNALATPWDLLLMKPYRDGGPAINAWEIAGLQVGVDVAGQPEQARRSRSRLERRARAALGAHSRRPPRRIVRPRPGDRWRVNFSRVQWQTDRRAGQDRQAAPAGSSEPLPEDNWVWSPQGVIDMHVPERWGYVQFGATASALDPAPAMVDTNERLKWALRLLYYRQRDYHRTRERYATTLEELGADRVRVPDLTFRPALRTTDSLYEITAPGDGGRRPHRSGWAGVDYEMIDAGSGVEWFRVQGSVQGFTGSVREFSSLGWLSIIRTHMRPAAARSAQRSSAGRRPNARGRSVIIGAAARPEGDTPVDRRSFLSTVAAAPGRGPAHSRRGRRGESAGRHDHPRPDLPAADS